MEISAGQLSTLRSLEYRGPGYPLSAQTAKHVREVEGLYRRRVAAPFRRQTPDTGGVQQRALSWRISQLESTAFILI